MAISLSDLVTYQAKDPQQALDDAVAAVRSYCGWHVTPSQAGTEVIWSPDGRSLFLKTLALTAVTSVTQDSAGVNSTSYIFETYGLISRISGAFNGRTKVTVVYTHGLADWPADAKGVILSLAQRSISDTRGIVPRVGGAGGSVVVMENYGAQLTEGDKAKLAPYALSPICA